mmetsp:Transcript_3128/g.6520  ORF Transcript_3128/g.6520 Transcript_3128/m.6520 type:complete len:229 (+) Transcript_3128:803-1489(+)
MPQAHHTKHEGEEERASDHTLHLVGDVPEPHAAESVGDADEDDQEVGVSVGQRPSQLRNVVHHDEGGRRTEKREDDAPRLDLAEHLRAGHVCHVQALGGGGGQQQRCRICTEDFAGLVFLGGTNGEEGENSQRNHHYPREYCGEILQVRSLHCPARLEEGGNAQIGADGQEQDCGDCKASLASLAQGRTRIWYRSDKGGGEYCRHTHEQSDHEQDVQSAIPLPCRENS